MAFNSNHHKGVGRKTSAVLILLILLLFCLGRTTTSFSLLYRWPDLDPSSFHLYISPRGKDKMPMNSLNNESPNFIGMKILVFLAEEDTTGLTVLQHHRYSCMRIFARYICKLRYKDIVIGTLDSTYLSN
ncbi:hypothetical protein F4678DRAFT_260939 [Xylaria arbuscula]|nr:hypothetical protein F4678DRAFT_260939 [Xylaria arbuscula]